MNAANDQLIQSDSFSVRVRNKHRRYPGRAYEPRTVPWSTVLVHGTHGRLNNTFAAESNYLLRAVDVTAQLLIGKAGEIDCILPFSLAGWHSGDCLDNRFENARSIGIELHIGARKISQANRFVPDLVTVNGWQYERVTQVQANTLGRMLAGLAVAYGVAPNEVASHRSQAIEKDGTLGRKSDPGSWPEAALNEFVARCINSARDYNFTSADINLLLALNNV